MDLPIEDADRDRVIAALQRGHVAGYLDQSTLNRRVEVALSTKDTAELDELLADLPGLTGRAGFSEQLWTPGTNQQLSAVPPAPAPVPYQPNTEPAWLQFLRNSWPWLVGAVPIVLFIWIFLAPGGGQWWLWFWIFFIFIRPALRTHRQRQRPAAQPYPPSQPGPPGPPDHPKPQAPPQDSFNPDDGTGGQWNQPPAR